MKSRKIYLAFGSNLGDRKRNILEARDLVSRAFASPCLKFSSLIETRAEGFDGPDFLDAVGLWESALPAQEILSVCKSIERELGRSDEGIRTDASGQRIYSSRPIDIDILMIGDETIRTASLTVPHPRMKERDFVMCPLREIIGDFE